MVYSMSLKSSILIFVLSFAITIFLPIIGFLFGLWKISNGFPFKWTGFLQSTNYTAFNLDILFWFVTLWIVWKSISFLSGRGGRKRRKKT